MGFCMIQIFSSFIFRYWDILRFNIKRLDFPRMAAELVHLSQKFVKFFINSWINMAYNFECLEWKCYFFHRDSISKISNNACNFWGTDQRLHTDKNRRSQRHLEHRGATQIWAYQTIKFYFIRKLVDYRLRKVKAEFNLWECVVAASNSMCFNYYLIVRC